MSRAIIKHQPIIDQNNSFAQASGTTLHLSGSGRNDHHLAEAAFKALARALRMAVTTDPRRSGVASTKGSLELDGGGA